jgi:cyclophilin family peptidyl-prolyl cis-trans isomerase
MKTTARFPSRARRSSRLVFVEFFESRLMFHASAPIVPLPDITRPTNATADTIDLSQSFAEATSTATRVAFGFDLGRVVVELFDTAAPLTVANFLNYSRSERYDNTVIHRSANLGPPNNTPFVIQGGGYRESDLRHIATDAAVQNEFRPNTVQRGTIAMAKQGGNPNSATSEWFFNLRDNKDILDPQNGGFTSFGQVLGNGMTVVDQIAALPTTTRSGITEQGGPISLSDFPIEKTPPTPPQDYVNVEYIAELPKLASVSSSNTGIVTAGLSGTSLVLNYVPGAFGTATITINGTDRTGAPVSDSFDVGVGFADVNVGEGTTARTVTYTDADGTVGVVTVNGGTARITFEGGGVTQTPSGRNIDVTGTGLEMASLTAIGGTPSVTVKTKGGGDGVLSLGGLNGGAIRSFSGKTVVLKGTSNIQQGIGRLDLAQTQAASITIGAPADPRLTPAITIGGAATDTDITSAGAIKSLRVGSWGSTDAEADTVSTPMLASLQSNGDFGGSLTLTGAQSGNTINTAKVKGAVSGTWAVAGFAGNVSAGSTAASWVANFGGSLRTLAVAGDLSGTVTANSINTVKAGSVTGANLTLTQPAAAGAVALRSLNSKGAMANTNLRATASDIGTVAALSITNSTIFAGFNPENAALPTALTDITGNTTIRGVTVRNRSAASFVNSDVAAHNIGKLNLGVVQTANAGVPFGAAADSITSVVANDAAGARLKFSRLDDPVESKTSADFVLRVF